MSLLAAALSIVSFMSAGDLDDSLHPLDGMTYLRAAENIASEPKALETSRVLTEQLYVLSAIIDPILRDSAIIGLRSIQDNLEMIQKLDALRLESSVLLVPEVVVQNVHSELEQSETVQELCATLNEIRAGEKVNESQLRAFSPFRFRFPSAFDRLMKSALVTQDRLSAKDMTTSLRIELEVLGGPTLWSADYAATDGRGVFLHTQDNLALLFNVDITKRIRRNGNWVIE
jgi:hypothetical protein